MFKGLNIYGSYRITKKSVNMNWVGNQIKRKCKHGHTSFRYVVRSTTADRASRQNIDFLHKITEKNQCSRKPIVIRVYLSFFTLVQRTSRFFSSILSRMN